MFVVVVVVTTCLIGHPGILFTVGGETGPVRFPTVANSAFATKFVGSSGIGFVTHNGIRASDTGMVGLATLTLDTISM